MGKTSDLAPGFWKTGPRPISGIRLLPVCSPAQPSSMLERGREGRRGRGKERRQGGGGRQREEKALGRRETEGNERGIGTI